MGGGEGAVITGFGEQWVHERVREEAGGRGVCAKIKLTEFRCEVTPTR